MAACATEGGHVTTSGAHVVILYASDLHSQLIEGSDDLGGYARLQTLVNQERAKAGPKTDVILVLGGDSIGKGRLPCRKTNEAKCTPILGMLKPDVVAFGNGELKMPLADLRSLSAQIGGVWVGSNIEPAKKGVMPFWKSSYLYTGPKSGLKINFTSSAVFPGPGEARSGGQLDFVEPSVSFVDLYSKYGTVPGAASLMILHDDIARLDEIQRGLCHRASQPLLVLKAHEHKVDQGTRGCLKYLEADAFGRHVARLELAHSENAFQIKNIQMIEVNSKIQQDPAVAAKVEDLYKNYGQGARRVVLNLVKPVDENRLGKFLASTYQRISRADIAIVNRGFIKAGFPAGKVDWDTVLTAVPYNNQLFGLDWPAADLEKSLCRAAKRTMDRHLDNGGELIFAGASLVDAGKDNCRLVVKDGKKVPKVVVDSYLQTRSGRWLGKDIKGRSFSYGLDTERALELGIEKYAKEL